MSGFIKLPGFAGYGSGWTLQTSPRNSLSASRDNKSDKRNYNSSRSSSSSAESYRRRSSSSSMHKRESILSQFYQRARKESPPNRHEPAVHSNSGFLSEDGLSPQASSSSTRSTSSVKTNGSIYKPAPHKSAQKPPSIPEKEEDAVSFKIRLETPPAIMYGTPQESVGALISGICDVDLTRCRSQEGNSGNGVDLLEVSMSIVQVIKYLVPPQVAKKLPKGTEQRNVLATWDISKHPHLLEYAHFEYPFSHLLPGTLPPTSNTPLFSIEYFIQASATTKDQRKSNASLPLKIGRSVMSVTEKTSVRIFPPTELSLSMVLPTALFPNSQVQSEMRIEGLITSTGPGSTLKYKRWQLKRINWRVDELIKVRFGERSEDEYEHKHTLGFGVHKTGWKTDYSLQTGHVELSCAEFCPGVLSKANKDLQDPVAGLSVSHQLICELLIAEEVVSSPSVKQGVLSGSARVSRMQFGFPVVDRPGLGISWEDEVPPMYADIPSSPPQYNEVADLPSFEEFKTNNLVFSPSLVSKMSPTSRHFDPNMRGFEHIPSPLISSTSAIHSPPPIPAGPTPPAESESEPTFEPLARSRSLPPVQSLSLEDRAQLHPHHSAASGVPETLLPPAPAKSR